MLICNLSRKYIMYKCNTKGFYRSHKGDWVYSQFCSNLVWLVMHVWMFHDDTLNELPTCREKLLQQSMLNRLKVYLIGPFFCMHLMSGLVQKDFLALLALAASLKKIGQTDVPQILAKITTWEEIWSLLSKIYVCTGALFPTLWIRNTMRLSKVF